MAKKRKQENVRGVSRNQYYVVRARKGWSVKKGGREGLVRNFPTKRHAVAYGRRVARRDATRVVIHDGGRARKQADFVSTSTEKTKVEAGFGGAEGLIKIAPDFDEPLSEFDDYT